MGRSKSTSLSPRAAAALLGLFAVLAGALWLLNHGGASSTASTSTTTKTASAPTSVAAGSTGSNRAASTQRASSPRAELPARPASSASLRTKAGYVLAVVDATGRPPEGYVGGRQFMNDERGGTTALPFKDSADRRLTYHEYDVNPRKQGVDRGPQRLVVGSDGSAFMTGDHYVTWQRLR